jgi:hypothetical protein
MGVNRRQQLAARLQREEAALREAQRGLDGTEGGRMRYLAARVEYAEAERDAVGVLFSASPLSPAAHEGGGAPEPRTC